MNDSALELAWFWHQKLNKHHWNYWVIVDSSENKALKMPKKYVLEMIADWTGAAAAKGTGTALDWYKKSGSSMILHEETRNLVESILNV